MRLEGKVAIITGGARGQGATEARMFAQEGAKVVIGDVRDELGMQVEAEIRELGGEAVYLHLDVANADDWQNAVDTAEQRFGKVDVLVNNAAIVLRKDIEETTAEDWDNIMDINAKGVFLGTRAVIPAMRRAGGGSIINISSISGLVSIGPPAYIATKGAVRLVHQVNRHPVRLGKHPRQLHPPWRGGHRYAPGRAGKPNARRNPGAAEPDPVRPRRHHRGHILRRAVPGLRRVIVYDRQRTRHRRRLHR